MPVAVIHRTVASKLGDIAATWRAGTGNPYATCPQTCNLLPEKEIGTYVVDQRYLAALLDAVPRNGYSWTYSHFPHAQLPQSSVGRTVINASTDTLPDALAAADAGYPTVYAAPLDSGPWPQRINGRRFVECPASKHPDKVTCGGNATTRPCGGEVPLCARPVRDYIIVFPAHGSRKHLLGKKRGGCYAAQGPCRSAWDKTANHQNRVLIPDDDPAGLIHWAKSLRPGSLIRHHIAGDIGLPSPATPHFKGIPIASNNKQC